MRLAPSSRVPAFSPDARAPREVYRLEPRGDAPAPRVFTQGAHPPVSIRWYGITSLFGHFRNFTARAIASESVDSRDWMRPQSARELLDAVARVLGARGTPAVSAPGASSPPGEPAGDSLVEALGRPLWIDFVADTGDDRDVSRGVATMLFAPYTVDDPAQPGGSRALPRGDLLVFGGDTAYPVATVDEIQRRVIEPWNEALREAHVDGETRVLLGVPGNHDWYDGLDGFARMFRRGAFQEGEAGEPFSTPGAFGHLSDAPTSGPLGSPSIFMRPLPDRAARGVGLVMRQLHLDEALGLLAILAAWGRSVLAFFRGAGVRRQRRLQLTGYEAVQEASFWQLPLAPALDLWGVDRQLGGLDFRQRAFFKARREQLQARSEQARIAFVAPDPALAFGNPNPPGQRMLAGCGLNLDRDPLLYLTGDLHHYERRTRGRALHVIAGGGGAFLHGTRIKVSRAGASDCAYPDARATRALVLQVPWKLMVGRAGLLVHLALFLLASVVLGATNIGGTRLQGHAAMNATAVLVSLGITAGLYAIAAYQGAKRLRVLAITVPFGFTMGLLPAGLSWFASHLRHHVLPPHLVPAIAGNTATMLASAFLGALVFGFFLVLLALTGIEHQQAFAVLGHPGFKHFVRLCLHPDGSIEGWVIGKDDVLVPGPPRLVDRFRW